MFLGDLYKSHSTPKGFVTHRLRSHWSRDPCAKCFRAPVLPPLCKHLPYFGFLIVAVLINALVSLNGFDGFWCLVMLSSFLCICWSFLCLFGGMSLQVFCLILFFIYFNWAICFFHYWLVYFLYSCILSTHQTHSLQIPFSPPIGCCFIWLH